MTVVAARDLSRSFPVGRGVLHAVDRVSFDVAAGETLGLVGESGSGKSTTGRMLVGLLAPSEGSLRLFGEQIAGPGGARAFARVRAKVQFVFQDPAAALDPRMRAGNTIAEPLIAAGASRRDRAARAGELLDLVGLPRDAIDRYPHEFSGGQRQRLVIARALAREPAFIVCDEPVSSLDVSMQAQIVNLLLDLRDRLGLSYLFIAHDLAVTRAVSTRVAVMYGGRLVEIAPRRALYESPAHPYTQALLAAVPRPDPAAPPRPVLGGEVPSLLDRPAGCLFHARCPHTMPRCREAVPELREVASQHAAACHLFSA